RFRDSAKTVRLPAGILFAIRPESRSPSARNDFRVHPGTLFALARNPQALRSPPQNSPGGFAAA
ncbi:MAG TPA: hypothetical protein VH639_10940, partial [Bryobacteraceae bacterium]